MAYNFNGGSASSTLEVTNISGSDEVWVGGVAFKNQEPRRKVVPDVAVVSGQILHEVSVIF